jgi:hypothetical protein
MKYVLVIKVFLFCLTIVSHIIGSEDIDSISKAVQIKEKKPYQFSVHVGGTYHSIVNKPKKIWDNYITYGMHFDFPSDIEGLKIKFGIEAGSIENKNSHIYISLLHTSLIFTYEFRFFSSSLSVKPHIGLTNTVICLIPNIEIDDLLKETLHPTRQFESEFGILCGIKPIVKFKKIRIGIPVYSETLLSYQDIVTINVALTLGVIF